MHDQLLQCSYTVHGFGTCIVQSAMASARLSPLTLHLRPNIGGQVNKNDPRSIFSYLHIVCMHVSNYTCYTSSKFPSSFSASRYPGRSKHCIGTI